MRADIEKGGAPTISLGRSKKLRNMFTTLDAAITIFCRSYKLKTAKLVRWLVKKSVEKLIEDKQYVIEEKNALLPLVSGDLQDRDKQVQAIKHANVGLLGNIHEKDQKIVKCGNTINHLRKSYVNHTRNPSLENIVMVVCKHRPEDNDRHFDYLYYIKSIQRCELTNS